MANSSEQKNQSFSQNSNQSTRDSMFHEGTTNVSAIGSSSSGSIARCRGATSTWLGSALNVETLIRAAENPGTQIEAPSSIAQDQILFMINNIPLANVQNKAVEFAAILQEQYYPWFAQLMVMKRVSTEPNFHDSYIKFLDCVNSKSLYKAVIRATYDNCKVLLKSELIKSSSEERLLLKNLGSWLGKLTIGRNYVLRASEINLKSLIIEAYKKGLLIALIPFTCKILEPCQSSIIYKPPNPWTTAILQLLAEIRSVPGLKSNIEFEIEVLFRKLGIDMRDIKPSSLLKDIKREVVDSPDFHPLRQSFGVLEEVEKGAGFGLSRQLRSPQGLFPAGPSRTTYPVNEGYMSLETILMSIRSSVLSDWIFRHIVDKAIREVAPAIYKSSTTSSTSTVKELLIKKYFRDSDETILYNVAHSLVETFAGSLAYIKSKENLCIILAFHLRNLFRSLNMKREFLDLAVQIVTNDYLELGARLIQDAAIKKVIEDIDKELSCHIAMRRRSVVSPPQANLYTHL